MSDANPYAASTVIPDLGAPTRDGSAIDAARIAAAQARLDAHLADPDRRLADEALPERRLRTAVIVAWVICFALGALAVGLLGGKEHLQAISIIAFFVCAIVGLVAVIGTVLDLRIPPRTAATDPLVAARGWAHALRQGRGGYLLASLGPLAREQTLAVPDLAPLRTGEGAFAADDPAALRRWARTFACPGSGQVRWAKVRNLRLVEQKGDVAVVSSDWRLQSWPQWANAVSVLAFLFIRLVGMVVALVLFLALRKRRTATITKVLIRGRDQRWYLVDAGFDDGAVPALS